MAVLVPSGKSTNPSVQSLVQVRKAREGRGRRDHRWAASLVLTPQPECWLLRAAVLSRPTGVLSA